MKNTKNSKKFPKNSSPDFPGTVRPASSPDVDDVEQVKKDCFGYHKGRYGTADYCDALEVLDCVGCPFFKTKEKFRQDERRAKTRLQRKKRYDLIKKYK